MADEQRRGATGDETAATSVIGIVLMIAILVVAGAAVGLTAFEYFDEPPEPAPTTVLDDQYASYDGVVTINVTHGGGGVLERDALQVVGSQSGTLALVSASEYTAGDRLVDNVTVRPGETIVVRYERDDETTVLLETVAPTAGTSTSPSTTAAPGTTAAPTTAAPTTAAPGTTAAPTTAAPGTTAAPTTAAPTTTTGGGGGVPAFNLPALAVSVALATLLARRRRTTEGEE